MKHAIALVWAFAVVAVAAEENPSPQAMMEESEHLIVTEIESALSNKVVEVVGRKLDIGTVQADTNVTAAILQIDLMGRKLMDVDVLDNRIIPLNEKILAVLEALKERRSYKYLLWAEQRLEQVTRRLEQGKCSDSQKVQLYLSLGEVNVSLVGENMVAREIVSKMAEIYDTLDPDGKKSVRRLAIDQQRDPLTKIRNVKARKTLDEF